MRDIKVILRNPVVYAIQLVDEMANDFMAITKMVNYKHHLLFIAGLPKSGTTWTESLLSMIPGYIKLNGSLLRRMRGEHLLNHPHGINDKMLRSAPKNRYSFLKRHTHYESKYINIIEKLNLKFCIQIRDIRDMLISRYYHVLADEQHWQNSSISRLDFNDGFHKSVLDIIPNQKISVIDFYVKWMEDWIEYNKQNKKNCIIIKYEDMNNNIFEVFKSILEFYEFEFLDENISKMIDKQNKKHIDTKNLKENLRLPGNLITTFRKGETGSWKYNFSGKHCKIFKEKAGSLLVTLGYEYDYDW